MIKCKYLFVICHEWNLTVIAISGVILVWNLGGSWIRVKKFWISRKVSEKFGFFQAISETKKSIFQGKFSKNSDFFMWFHKKFQFFKANFAKNFDFLGNFTKNFDFLEKFPKNFEFFQAISQRNRFFRANFRKISIFFR